jgi:hypothetical protein
MAKSPNRLLASLPADAFSAISPHLKIVELKFGDVLAEAGSPFGRSTFLIPAQSLWWSIWMWA